MLVLKSKKTRRRSSMQGPGILRRQWGAVFVLLAVYSGGVQGQQDGRSQAPGTVTTAAPSNTAPSPPTSILPRQRTVAQPVTQPDGPAKPPVKLQGGATLSDSISRSRIIEDESRPERVQVYPDDPDSAWWEINPEYAFARAQREQKPLLLLFTAIWNSQAMGLSKEVFSTKNFNDYVKKNLVICYLNYPRNITDAPRELRRLKEKFRVMGYPNVLLFNPNGEVNRGIRGYRSGRPVDYFNRLKVACRPVLESIVEQKKVQRKQGYRDWSNYMGKVIFAKFVKRDDSLVALLDVSGRAWYIPINDLAPDDQRLVESFPMTEKIALKEKK